MLLAEEAFLFVMFVGADGERGWGGKGGLPQRTAHHCPGAATIAPLLYILITHQWGAVVIKSFYLEINIAIYTFLNQTKTMAYLTVN